VSRPISLTPRSLDELVRRNDRTAILYFGAPWCRHCRATDPLIERLAADRPDVLVAKVDVEDYPELAAEFRIRSIPTVIRLDGGELTLTSLGGVPYEVLLCHLGLETSRTRVQFDVAAVNRIPPPAVEGT
jgi:thioredoxin 1